MVTDNFAPRSLILRQGQWAKFCFWTATRRETPIPATPDLVIQYIYYLLRLGRPLDTIRGVRAAISQSHRRAHLPDPCSHPTVAETIAGIYRLEAESGVFRSKAALTAERMEEVRRTATRPRRLSVKRTERPQEAWRRGLIDIACISLMRDGLLRASEVASLTWNAIKMADDGTGRLIRTDSPPDEEFFISEGTMRDLISIYPQEIQTRSSIFGMTEGQIRRRIKRAALYAGLGDNYSGNSPRIGMAQDMLRAGIDLKSVMRAGRWRLMTMPARYLQEPESSDAVMDFYQSK